MFMVSEKGFCLPQHKFPTVIQLITNKYIILIIWFYILFPRHPNVFFISSWEDLRGFDSINYILNIYSTDTNGVKNYMQLYGKNWSQWPKEIYKIRKMVTFLFLPFLWPQWSVFAIQLHVIFYTFGHQPARLVCVCIKM